MLHRPFYPDRPTARRLQNGPLGTTGNLTNCLENAPRTRGYKKRVGLESKQIAQDQQIATGAAELLKILTNGLKTG